MSNTNYKLPEKYPLKREAGTVAPHDLSKGLRRHMPVGYDQLGRYRERRRSFPTWALMLLVLGATMVARAAL